MWPCLLTPKLEYQQNHKIKDIFLANVYLPLRIPARMLKALSSICLLVVSNTVKLVDFPSCYAMIF